MNTSFPLLFVSHGAPMFAIEPGLAGQRLAELGRELPRPDAIVILSPHWMTRGEVNVTASTAPETIHDFGGFPQALFDVQYPAKGSPELAVETKRILSPVEIELDETWGLDHGAWSVIKHLYPEANVPVIQLSIDYTKPGQYHFELAQKLQSLRHKGVLIIGSGNIVHNLRLIDFHNYDKDNYGYDWAIEARQTINDYLLDGNFQPLINFEKMDRAMQLAIPTPDHYLPMLYTLGLKEKSEELSLFNDKLMAGSLSMTSVKIM